ncbi:flagellar export chaperone FliS [Thalassoroseus pseudoceratinae]|uniref:flagellar export chaperone FliS n=1 Tax=Thalassoroseus pseudoceratinae TaxID=2713176 RepID=UPI0014219EAC|nr:flagellar export chaperone FliS [Thalassoroseus pseudoceratinae]
MTSQSAQYLSTEVLTASPYRLHQMVVDAALRFAYQAEAAIAEPDREVVSMACTRSREFVAELISGLREDSAPELVSSLKALFVFVYRNLAEAERDCDAEKLQAAIRVLTEHRQTWQELGNMINGPTTPTDANVRLNRSA